MDNFSSMRGIFSSIAPSSFGNNDDDTQNMIGNYYSSSLQVLLRTNPTLQDIMDRDAMLLPTMNYISNEEEKKEEQKSNITTANDTTVNDGLNTIVSVCKVGAQMYKIYKDYRQSSTVEEEKKDGENLKQNIKNLTNLVNSKVELREVLKREQEKVKEQYDKIMKEYLDEQKDVKKFDKELNDPNIKTIILIGSTGHGKSTIANRLCNDKSLKGNEKDFNAGNGVVSETKRIQKTVVHNEITNKVISVVDTPGFFDSDGRDRQIYNDMIEYLRGCGGVNAFVIVYKKGVVDFNIKFMLSQINNRFGPKVWKNVIFGITNVDTDVDKDEFPKWSKEFLNAIKKDLPIEDDIMNITGFSNHRPDCWQGIKKLLDFVPETKYECNELKSPLNELKQHVDLLTQDLKTVNDAFFKCDNEIMTLRAEINNKTLTLLN